MYIIKGIAILDNDGNRILAKVSCSIKVVGSNAETISFQYYDDAYPTAKEQRGFEKNLFAKTHRANGEIIMLDGFTCVYKNSVDLFFYVMGSSSENGVSTIIVDEI